ncbi:MAG: VCBS repeat-containing protein [Candidatus Accumulibacter sp.]|nr:VCBS repeat-containing protein [Accumulibacter sp.]
MRQSVEATDRPDSPPGFSLAPLLSALRRALRRVFPALQGKQSPPGQACGNPPSSARACETSPRIYFEAIEPRLLLSGDPVSLPMATIEAAGAHAEVQSHDATLAERARVLVDRLAGDPPLDGSATTDGEARLSTDRLGENRFLELAAPDVRILDVDFNADRRQDLVVIGERPDGNAFARLWQATGVAYLAGETLELGAWRPESHYLVGDVSGTGSTALVEVSPNDAGQAMARTWLIDGAGFSESTSTLLGAWSASARYLLGDMAGLQEAELLRLSDGGDGHATIDLWRFNDMQWRAEETAFDDVPWESNGWISLSDTNGDGKLEVLEAQLTTVDDRDRELAVVLRSADEGYWSSALQELGDWRADHHFLMGDLDGLGSEQLLRFSISDEGRQQVTVWRPNAWGWTYDNQAITLELGEAHPNAPWHAADLDGDVRMDLARVWQNADGRWVLESWLTKDEADAETTTMRLEQRPDLVLDLGPGETDFRFLDHNGDGRADLVGTQTNQQGEEAITLWLNDGPGFVALPASHRDRGARVLPADLNGDGRGDLLELSRTTEGTAVATPWLSTGDGFTAGSSVDLGIWQASTHFLVGDLDADGRSDLLEIRRQDDGQVSANTWLAGTEHWLPGGSTALGTLPQSSGYTLSDSTGDGRADLVVYSLPGNGNTRFTIWPGNGRTFAEAAYQETPSENLTTSAVLPLDLNGDGRGDFAYVDREPDANSGGYTTAMRWWQGGADGRWEHYDGDTTRELQPFAQHFTYLTGDVDGDARQDVLRVWSDAHVHLDIRRSHGSNLGDWTSPSTLGNTRNRQQFLSADVNGDGRADLLQIWQDSDGEAVASVWMATVVGEQVQYLQGGDNVLGAWREDSIWLAQDHNGDGRADLVGSWQESDGRRQIGTWLSDGVSLTTLHQPRSDVVTFDADFNGDGRRDLLEVSRRADGMAVATPWLSTGSGFAAGRGAELGVWLADTPYRIGDLDGDGSSDLLEIRRQPNGNVVANTWLGGSTTLVAAATTNLGPLAANSHYTLGDTTADGRADLLVQSPSSDGASRFTLWQGDGRRFREQSSQEEARASTPDAQILPLDMNGDGSGDLVEVQRDYRHDANLSDQSTRLRWQNVSPDGIWSSGEQSIGVWSRNVSMLATDADGDARGDVLRISKADDGQMQLTLWRSQGNTFDNWGDSTLGEARLNQVFHAADLNGDGRGDLLQIWQDSDGRTVATRWLATLVDHRISYLAAGDNNLGIWHAGATYVVQDHNGDGRADLVASWQESDGTRHIGAWLTDGVSLPGHPDRGRELRVLAADFAGDDRSELLELSRRPDGMAMARLWLPTGDDLTGGFTPGNSSLLGSWQASTQYLVGDLDADGRSELLEIRRQADGEVVANSWRPGADGLLAVGSTALGQYPPNSRYTLTDTTGDGQADLVVQWLPGNGVNRLTVWQGSGLGFSRSGDRNPYRDETTSATALSLDYNGDGRGDFVFVPRDADQDPNTSELSTRLLWLEGAPTGLLSTRYHDGGLGIWSQNVDFLTGDADGDGLDDVLRIWKNEDDTLRVTAWRSAGSSHDDWRFEESTTDILAGALANQQFVAADVDGNGRTDLLQIGQDDSDRAIARVWLAGESGYAAAGSGILGAWLAEAHYFSMPGLDGAADLVRSAADGEGAARFDRWRYVGGIASGDSLLPIVTQPLPPAGSDNFDWGPFDQSETTTPQADLTIGSVRIAPAGNWSPGDLVTVSWSTTNSGTLDIDNTWSERLEVYNGSTGELIATRTVVQELVDGRPALASGESSKRLLSFVWPDDTTGSGRIIFRIVVDDHNSVPENNAGGTGEANNESSYSVANAPDLRVINLHTLPGERFAGDELHISWEDRNDGSSATQTGWNDHLLIRNRSTGEILFDAAVPYDPAQPGNGSIAAGASRLRSQVFRLPEGVRGVGEIEISVSTDEGRDGQGALLEINTRGDAESNNRAVTTTTATARPYADLRVDALVAPSSAVGTLPIRVSWSVSNQGSTDADQDWTDQIVYSTDALIGDADDVVIASVRHSGGLRVGESYSQTAEVAIPIRSAGRYHLGIRSDSGTEVLEPDTRADNQTARAIDIIAPYADLVLDEVNVPRGARSGETIVVNWVVRNQGNVTTNRSSWSDRVVLSSDTTLSSDDLVLAGAVAHAGVLAAGQSTPGRATITLPRDLSGDYFVIVQTNAGRNVDEAGLTLNNIRASNDVLAISLTPTPDLTVAEVLGPCALRPGDTASMRYTVSNSGTAATSNVWRDRIYIDRGEQGGLQQVATVLHTSSLQAGDTVTQTVDFVLPATSPEGEFRWLVRTDADNSLYERHAEDNNETSASVQVARPDLVVSEVRAPTLARSGDRIEVEWRVGNQGASASGDWVDTVYLVQGTLTRPLAEVAHAAGLAAGASYTASTAFDIPLECDGDYQLVVATDSARRIDDHEHKDNRQGSTLHVDRAPYADLVVSEVSAPARVIGDPARFAVNWRVGNQGNGAGRSGAWSDRVVFSTDTVLGNADDRVVGEYRHVGALAAGESYAGAAEILLPPATAARYRLFVVTDAQGEVFENFAEANNVGQGTEVLDIMPLPYADLQVASVGTQGTPASGRPLRVTWEVINRGIGLSDSAEWSDQVWLSRHADGSDVVASFGSARHIGQLAVGDRYGRSLDVVLPEGISGNYYFNVRTGGPFEFIFGNNNTASSAAVPVSLSASPDLVVEKVEVPATGHEGASIDVSWSVLNQGEATAGEPWIDSLWLLPAGDEGQAIALGSFAYDRGLDPGMRYTRTEQVRLPAKIEGLYRVKVITNANLGGGGKQVYEHGAARANNLRTTADLIEVAQDQRPDLRVTAVSVPEHVAAGTAAGIRYTVSNVGATASNGRWTDKIYFSLDAKLSADDRLVGQFGNSGALAPGEAYTSETALIDIPIRQRGEAFLIVVADGGSQVDEYPNEGNNVRAAHLTIDPQPFADLVTSAVVAPDQAVHGASIEVRYQVTNHGSAATRGESAALDTWTDSIWLARDKRRPGAYKGDTLLASFTHIGKLGIGEDYLATAQVTIPDDALSGQYYLTVWSDTYDVMLEDTLATHINPDDPSQIDNNNYLARPISILGSTPPDLVLSQVVAPEMASAGDAYTFSYTVENHGERFTGSWVDAVYLTDNADWNAAREIWHLGNFAQSRSLGNGEKYTLTQTLPLAPSVSGRHLVVRTDVSNQVGETGESNNSRAAASLVTTQAADLRVTELRSEAIASSGEETTVTWTVGNFGAAVWSGTRGWVDAVYSVVIPSSSPSARFHSAPSITPTSVASPPATATPLLPGSDCRPVAKAGITSTSSPMPKATSVIHDCASPVAN